jgi:hypothetical protein
MLSFKARNFTKGAFSSLVPFIRSSIAGKRFYPLKELKKDYYEAMGYDLAPGNPPDSLLAKLGIEK